MRVCVLGGQGHIGSLIRSALSKVPGLEVTSASRRSGLDLRDPASLTQLPDSLLINCTDTYRLDPRPLYREVLGRRITLLETSAEAEAYLRMDEVLAEPRTETLGTLVPGVGVFPGLSNLCAAAVADPADESELRLDLEWSLISGAGAGTCEVMVQALRRPRLRWHKGQLERCPPLGRIERGLEIGLPEALLLPRSLGIQGCACFASLRPRLPDFVLRGIRLLCNAGLFRLPGSATVTRLIFGGLRKGLWRSRSTSLRMSAQQSGRRQELYCPDAFAAAGAMVAVAVDLLREQGPAPGLQPFEKLCSLETATSRAHALGLAGWQVTRA